MSAMEGDAFLDPKYQPGARRPGGAGQKYSGSGTSTGQPGKLLFVLPWLMFTLICMLFTYGYHHIPVLVWTTALLCACFAMIFMFTNSAGDPDRSAVVLGILCSFGVGLAILGGLANYSWHMSPYWAYQESREYHNVRGDEPAAAHADAGKIFFSESAQIDTTKAVGFKKGQTYCVAPILEGASGTRVEYWAVGIDCCAQRGEFACGDAAAEGTAAAHGGVVVMDNSFLNGASHFEYFAKAVKEAEAANDLVSDSEPIYLYWVKDPDAVQSGMFTKGTTTALLYSALFLVFNGAFAWAAQWLLGRAAKRAAPPGYGAA